jgi:hypothetical protein
MSQQGAVLMGSLSGKCAYMLRPCMQAFSPISLAQPILFISSIHCCLVTVVRPRFSDCYNF